MAELSFSQPERRSYLLPAAIVAVLVGAAFAAIDLFTPHRIADLAVTHIAVLPTHTVFKNDTIVVKDREQVQDDLYVLATVRLQDDLKLPIFVKDITATLTTSDGAVMSASATEKLDLPNLYTTFPALVPLSGPPLLRETELEPGAAAEGMVLLHFPVAEAIWKQRRSAVISVDLYHQGPLTVAIPAS